jgi:hypothetical protein
MHSLNGDGPEKTLLMSNLLIFGIVRLLVCDKNIVLNNLGVTVEGVAPRSVGVTPRSNI